MNSPPGTKASSLPAHKRAKTHHPIHEYLQLRWSPVAFASKLVEKETLRSLFEAARWAASSFNEQPWSYLVATKDEPEEFQKMLGVLVEGNQAWAKNAPVLAISVAKKTFAQNGKPNRFSWHDVGQASANLTFEATSRGLAVHQMAGFNPGKTRELYGIPDDYEPVAAMAIGYPGDVDQLPEDLRNREKAERTRKPLTEFVFTGQWGKSASIGAA